MKNILSIQITRCPKCGNLSLHSAGDVDWCTVCDYSYRY